MAKIKWKFKDREEPHFVGEEYWYAITNGYLNPKDFLSNKYQLKLVKEAVKVLKSFENALINGNQVDCCK